jgi:uncharacterized cupredoxin-like copper-binding protein
MRALAAVALALMTGVSGGSPPGTQAIRIDVRYSRFLPAVVSVRAGQTVRFEIANLDPVAHEFVLGTPAEQLAHERARAASHDGVPGQATLGVGESKAVTWTFTRPGTLVYACHRAGHYAFGMAGTVRVLPGA